MSGPDVSGQAVNGSGRYSGRTALVVVDLQNDFALPSGGLYVRGGEELLAPVSAEVAAARAAGSLVVWTQDWHPPRTPHFDIDGGVWPVHCVAGTWGAELVDGSPALPGDPVIQKGVAGGDGYSGFSVRDPGSGEVTATSLHEVLLEADVTDVVVVGLAGDVCVRATALDAVALGYATTVPLGCTRFVELQPGDGERAAADLAEAGVTVLPA